MKFLTNINDEKYTEFIKNHKHGNMMQAIEWSHIKNTWGAVRVGVQDENNNIIKSEKYEEIESEGNIIINKENKKIIATIGVEDIVIVNTEDALLVCHKDKSQEIKKILDKIEKK